MDKAILRRRTMLRGTICGCAIAILISSAAAADGNFFQNLLQGLQNAAAQSAWQTVDPEVQNCMASKYNLNPSDLASQGVGPNDPRVSPDVADCQQLVAQQQQQPQDQQQTQNQQPAEDPAERLKELTGKYGRKAAKQIVAGNIDMGMNEDEVTDAWGDPNNREQEANGKEKWSFGQDVVTFTHGKVTAVGH